MDGNVRARGVTAVVACVVLFFTGCQTGGGARETNKGQERMEVFLLAGQSNMAGRGEVEAFDRLVWPNLFCLGADDAWRPAIEPLHYDKPARVGVGPGSTFGRIVAGAYPGREIGLVPVACGGSSIEVWTPGVFHAGTSSHPYDDAVARARRAARDGRLRAILWIQGESDSTAERAPLYYTRLKTLIEALRRDLNADDVPFIIGRLPRFSDVPKSSWRTMVGEAQARAARELPQVYFVDMPVLTSLPDGIHADAPSAREMGRRLAEAYLQLEGRRN